MSTNKYIISLDQGTTNSRSVLINVQGEIKDIEKISTTTYYPKPDWFEQNPLEILENQLNTLTAIIKRNSLKSQDIIAIGIANQRETVVIWNKKTGVPIYNAITWQDRRTLDYCNNLKSQNIHKIIKEKTGLIVDPYFSASKIKWILDNIEGARQQAESGELCFGTIDTWLLYNLTNKAAHFTDITNASRTMLFNIHTETWDEELLHLFNIPKQILPQIKDSNYNFGSINCKNIYNISITSMLGDQQSALFGQQCFNNGNTKITYGTGCFMMTNTGTEQQFIDNILTTIAWKLKGITTYAIEGSIFTAGSAIEWIKNNLIQTESVSDIEKLAFTVDNSQDIYFVPALAGLGAPYWNEYARGLIIGITATTKQAHIARAALEAVSFQVVDLFNHIKKHINDYGNSDIKVDGGVTKNKMLVQFQADILQKTLMKGSTEATALGTAYMAGISSGYWQDIDSLPISETVEINPSMDKVKANKKYLLWRKAIERSLNWSQQ